ncbi:MAG: hypothetical protein H5T60_07205 [Anaerolineae bacterium]|nr:hypothetical protein [Anaerolineae bacterium]
MKGPIIQRNFHGMSQPCAPKFWRRRSRPLWAGKEGGTLSKPQEARSQTSRRIGKQTP